MTATATLDATARHTAGFFVSGLEGARMASVEIGLGKLAAGVAVIGGKVLAAVWALLKIHQTRLDRAERKANEALEAAQDSTTPQRVDELHQQVSDLGGRMERIQREHVSRSELDQHIKGLHEAIRGLGQQIDTVSRRLDDKIDRSSGGGNA